MNRQSTVVITTPVRRSDHIRGAFRSETDVFRPPWAAPEGLFVERCTRCGDCLPACPESILSPGRGGFPEIRFDTAGDTYYPDLYGSILKKFPETEGDEGLLVSADDTIDYDPVTGAISLTRSGDVTPYLSGTLSTKGLGLV